MCSKRSRTALPQLSSHLHLPQQQARKAKWGAGKGGMDGSKLPYPTLLQNILAGASPAIYFAGGAGAVEGPRQRKPFSGLCSCVSCAAHEGAAPTLPWQSWEGSSSGSTGTSQVGDVREGASCVRPLHSRSLGQILGLFVNFSACARPGVSLFKEKLQRAALEHGLV